MKLIYKDLVKISHICIDFCRVYMYNVTVQILSCTEQHKLQKAVWACPRHQQTD